MKPLDRRHGKLEAAAAPLKHCRTIAEILMERRRRRLEAEGKPPEKRLEVDYTGCHTIAEIMWRTRSTRQDAEKQAQKVSADNASYQAPTL